MGMDGSRLPYLMGTGLGISSAQGIFKSCQILFTMVS